MRKARFTLSELRAITVATILAIEMLNQTVSLKQLAESGELHDWAGER
jgi:hypothetical protein